MVVQVKPTVGLLVTERVTLCPLTGLAKASIAVTTGWVVMAMPAVVGVDGWVLKVRVAVVAALMVKLVLVAVNAPAVAVKV